MLVLAWVLITKPVPSTQHSQFSQIIIAFAVQGGISVVLATFLAWMTPRSSPAFQSLQQSVALGMAASWAVPQILLSSNINVTEVMRLVRNLRDLSATTIQDLSVVRQLKRTMRALERGDYKEAIQSLWLYNLDVAGLSSVPGFLRMLVTQGPPIGLSRAKRLAYLQGMVTKRSITRDLSADIEARIEIVNGILVAVSDAQLISGMSTSRQWRRESRDSTDMFVLAPGISLLVAALVIHQSLSLYHFHIIYDMTNFTA